MKRPTSSRSVVAVVASCWDDAAISCVEALVSCVDAETCSAEAEDCSATAATSTMSDSAREASAEIWRSAGFEVQLFEDVTRMVWEKLIMNVTFSGTSCATGLTIGEVMADPNAWGVAHGCAQEAIAVAEAADINLDVGDPIEHIRKLGGKIPNAQPSMLLDYNAGRRGEVDAINGSISRLGRKYGVPTPVNDTVVGIIKARERGFPT